MSESDNVHISNPGVKHGWPRTRLPLNSRYLTAEQIKRVERALGVPTDASVDEVHVMIEGKLREMEHDPANVQVVISSANMSLRGENSKFLSITEFPSTETPNNVNEERNIPDEASHADSMVQELEQLQTKLQDAKAEILTLKKRLRIYSF